jgi:DNA repair protein RadC
MKYSMEQQNVIDQALNYIRESLEEDGELFSSPSASTDFLQLYFQSHDLEREHFVVMFLDSQHRLLEVESLFSGTIDGAAVYPREVIKATLRHNAAAIVLSHNHPSGLAEPSSADRKITERIKSAAQLLDIRVFDHIIIASGTSYSFAEHGDI